MDGFSVLIGHYMYHVLYEERCNGLVYAIGGGRKTACGKRSGRREGRRKGMVEKGVSGNERRVVGEGRRE